MSVAPMQCHFKFWSCLTWQPRRIPSRGVRTLIGRTVAASESAPAVRSAHTCVTDIGAVRATFRVANTEGKGRGERQ
eukprot:1451686-Pyramimonas_sp.AAC.1